jgi:A/G-specific adenine glycosylase
MEKHQKFSTIWFGSFIKRINVLFPGERRQILTKFLVSEVMLQQTQADRVVAYYKKWVKRFPNVASLAKADFADIYPYWQGLGYNRRALALQKLAKLRLRKYEGLITQRLKRCKSCRGSGHTPPERLVSFLITGR